MNNNPLVYQTPRRRNRNPRWRIAFALLVAVVLFSAGLYLYFRFMVQFWMPDPR